MSLATNSQEDVPMKGVLDNRDEFERPTNVQQKCAASSKPRESTADLQSPGVSSSLNTKSSDCCRSPRTGKQAIFSQSTETRE
jgi:hypothetical protein